MTTCFRPLEASDAQPRSYNTEQSFPGRYESLAAIGEFVRKIAQEAGFSSFALYSIEMAVDEACSNIIEHAYGPDKQGKIRCTCSLNEAALTINLQDTGDSFNPATIPQPNLSRNLEDREPHGLGVYFIRKWMDEVHFYAGDEENILTMVKRRE